jgi:hypothetical protein
MNNDRLKPVFSSRVYPALLIGRGFIPRRSDVLGGLIKKNYSGHNPFGFFFMPASSSWTAGLKLRPGIRTLSIDEISNMPI